MPPAQKNNIKKYKHTKTSFQLTSDQAGPTGWFTRIPPAGSKHGFSKSGEPRAPLLHPKQKCCLSVAFRTIKKKRVTNQREIFPAATRHSSIPNHFIAREVLFGFSPDRYLTPTRCANLQSWCKYGHFNTPRGQDLKSRTDEEMLLLHAVPGSSGNCSQQPMGTSNKKQEG